MSETKLANSNYADCRTAMRIQFLRGLTQPSCKGACCTEWAINVYVEQIRGKFVFSESGSILEEEIPGCNALYPLQRNQQETFYRKQRQLNNKE